MSTASAACNGRVVRYEETQHFHPLFQVVFLAVIAVMAVKLASALVSGESANADPASVVTLSILLPTFALIYVVVFRLVIRVVDDGVEAEYGCVGLIRFRWPASELRQCEAVTYRPLREFGGWGVRLNLRGERCFNARGNRGVKLQVGDRTIILGSQRPDELCASITSLMNSR